MRKCMRYRITILLLLLLFPVGVLLFSVRVWAEDTVSKQDNWVEFNKNHKMIDNFSANGITDEAKNDLQPGDTITFQVSLRNTSSDTTAWYMRNEVLQTLESQQSIAEGGAYTYVLTYIGPKGTRVLYDSEAIGGSDENGDGSVVDGNVGLEQATVALDDEEYVYLDNLAPGARAQMTLKIGLDGETQGNDYQGTMARIELGFAAELVDPATGRPSSSSTRPSSSTGIARTSPKTGDTSQVLLFSVLTLTAGIVCIVLVVLRLKRKHEDRGEGGRGRYE